MANNADIPEWWMETTLGEFTNIIMGQSPTGESYNQVGEWMPFYQGVTEFREKFVWIKTFTTKPTKVVPPNTILFSVRAPVGRVNFTKHEACIGRWNAWIISKNWEIDFLFFLLQYVEKIIKNRSSGTVFDSISWKELKEIPIFLPQSSREQNDIGRILSSFDDKIELLREQNEILEKTAQTIFQEKFGKYSIDDDLPEGWRVGKITEIIKREPISYRCDKDDLDDRGTTPIIDQWANGLYWYTARNPDFIASAEKPVIVFTNHTCNYWFIDYPFCAIQNVLPYRWKDGYDEYFLYFLTKGSITFIEYKWHWPDFEAKDFIIPPVNLAQEYSSLAKPILEKISSNNSQIQTLSKTRDALLSKLMSGAIRA